MYMCITQSDINYICIVFITGSWSRHLYRLSSRNVPSTFHQNKTGSTRRGTCSKPTRITNIQKIKRLLSYIQSRVTIIIEEVSIVCPFQCCEWIYGVLQVDSNKLTSNVQYMIPCKCCMVDSDLMSTET